MPVEDFMQYIRTHCHHASDREMCLDLLASMTLSESEKHYCEGALDRRIRWILPPRRYYQHYSPAVTRRLLSSSFQPTSPPHGPYPDSDE